MPNYRFGKNPPKNDYRTLHFGKYLTPQLGAPPTSYNVLTERVFPKLHTTDLSELFPMDGNDFWGDCTIAALAHASTVYHGLLGTRKIMSEMDVLRFYSNLTGGVDSGASGLDALNYWRQHVESGEKVITFASISPQKHEHVKQAIRLFGGAFVGFQVQYWCQESFAAHEPWIPSVLTTQGHAVYAVGYDEKGLSMLTWGSIQKGTWEWWDECVDEAYAILPPEAKQHGFAPGFDYAQLLLDLFFVSN
jgi:hypothetical protein